MIIRLLSVLAVLAVVGSALEVVRPPRPLLVWNATSSAPKGLYRRSSGEIMRGAWVLIRPPQSAATLAAARDYLPARVPMVKRIAALAGDQVCRFGVAIAINGRRAALAQTADSQGRALPVWHGCKRLKSNEIFLLTAPAGSFDSRYFGAVSTANLIERIEPLWTFSVP